MFLLVRREFPECVDIPACDVAVTWAAVMMILAVVIILLLIAIIIINSLHLELHVKHLEPSVGEVAEADRGLRTTERKGLFSAFSA